MRRTLGGPVAVALALVAGTASPLGAQMDMQHPMEMRGGPLGIPETRMGSGTSWLPDDSPMHAAHFMLGRWALMLHGVGAFRAALDEKLDLTRLLYEALRDAPGFELPWKPDLTVVPFRYRPRSGDPEEFNRRLLDRINASRRVFLSSTMINGRFVIRACIVSFRTHRDRIEEAIGIIRSAAGDLDR